MEKFKFKPYNSSIDAGVFTMGNGYFESSGEADTRKQLSYPLSNIADYINDEVVPNVNENINSIGELDENVKKSIQELKNEFDTCKNDVSLLNGRVDTVTSLPSGSTTGDAELADIRVGANGITYPNAGGAVRGQISELKGDLVENYIRTYGIAISDANGWSAFGNDFDNLATNTMYAIWRNTNVLNLPCSNFAGNVVAFSPFSKSNATSKVQIAIPTSSDSIYIRSKISESANWTTWTKFENGKTLTDAIIENYINGILYSLDYAEFEKGFFFVPSKNLINVNDYKNSKESAYVSDSGAINTLESYKCLAVKIDSAKEKLSINTPSAFLCFFSNLDEGYLSRAQTGIAIPNFIGSHITSGSSTDNWSNIPIPENAKWVIVSANKTRFASMQLEYGSERTSYEPYKKTLNSIVKVPKESVFSDDINVVNVSSYANLRVCLETITPTKENPIIVEIPNGEYDIKSYYTEEEISASNFKGLFIPDYCTIRGIDSRELTVLKWENDSDDVNNNISTLNIYNVASLENITVKASNIRYCVHDDWATSYNGENVRSIKNCTFVKENGGYTCAYGAGMKGNAKWDFENCIFEGYGAGFSGLGIHNNENVTKDSDIYIKNCRFKNTYETSHELTFDSMTKNVTGKTYITLIGNKFSNPNSKIRLGEAVPESYGRGIAVKLSGYANNFSNDNVSIVVTDGNDYSANVDLI